MPGNTTNGLPQVGAPVQNGVTVAAPAGQYTQLTATRALIAADTETSSGATPQSVAVTPFQIAAHAAALISNTGSSSAGAATLNTVEGLITTESLSTAPGATYTFTLTNSLISATSPVPQVMLLDGTNTTGDTQINSITNASGSVVAVFQNTGSVAWNGKKLFAFHI